MKLKCKKLHPDAKIAVREHPDDSGADVFADNIKMKFSVPRVGWWKEEKLVKEIFPLMLAPGDRALVGTGLSCAAGKGYEIQVRPRSGLSLKTGITIANSPGTVDAGYRGEIGIILINSSQGNQKIEKGDKIAQLVVCKVECCEIEEVDDLDETERGADGFGSSDS